jgi:hypothetical protein
VDWIGLAHDRDKKRALVNAVMNGLHTSKMLGNYLMASQLAVSQVVLSSIELVSQPITSTNDDGDRGCLRNV